MRAIQERKKYDTWTSAVMRRAVAATKLRPVGTVDPTDTRTVFTIADVQVSDMSVNERK